MLFSLSPSAAAITKYETRSSSSSSTSCSRSRKSRRERPSDTAHKRQCLERPRALSAAPRRGKWSVEEEAFAASLIRNFDAGVLTLENGATLRAFLSQRTFGGVRPCRFCSFVFGGGPAHARETTRRRNQREFLLRRVERAERDSRMRVGRRSVLLRDAHL